MRRAAGEKDRSVEAKPAKKRRAIVPPGGVILRGLLLASWLWFVVPWLWTLCRLDGGDCYHMTVAEVRPDLRGIEHRLARGDAETMHKLFPEGRLFSHSFYGFTLINLAVSHPQDRAFRAEVLAALEREIPQVEGLATQAPFDRCQNMTPKGGIIAAGHANLLRAGYAMLGGADGRIVAAYHAASAELAAGFGKCKTGSLESYPSRTWPVDNVVALESLRLHDVLYHTDYGAAGRRWAEWMGAHLDKATGLMNMEIDQDGAIEDGPRGCGISWTLAFLPAMAPDLARQQYAVYRRDFFMHPLGTTGIREFPPGRHGTFMDSDTGPIIFDLGTAATGFGIAAAKANDDQENLTGLLRALELCSVPMWRADLSHDHFAGQVILADEIALWGKTLCRWDASEDHPLPPATSAGLKNYWVVILVVAAAGSLITWLFYRALRRAFERWREWPRPLPRVHRVLLAVSMVTVPAFLLVPGFSWLYAVLVLAGLEIVGTRFVPLEGAGTAGAA